MITCFLQGGLGNQMFQISAAHALSIELNSESIFDFSKCHTPSQGYTSSKYANNFFKNIKNSTLNLNSFKIYHEPTFSYNKLPLVDNLCIHGYFQSEKYFNKYRNEIINLFYFDDSIKKDVSEFLTKINNGENLTAVHVRRGDYMNLPDFHRPNDILYYQKSIDIIGDSNFIFVSDDIEWCKENFKGENIWFSNFNSEIHDLFLITQCTNIIMSNSSFSWWGVYMNNNKYKVIAPYLWFGNTGPQDTQDIYNKNWTLV